MEKIIWDIEKNEKLIMERNISFEENTISITRGHEMSKRYDLTDEEKKIEGEIETFKSVTGEKRKKVESILTSAKKNKAISLRIANYDLEKLKERAEKEGLPYQTLITTVLHKYITNQLFERDEIIRSIRLLKEEQAI